MKKKMVALLAGAMLMMGMATSASAMSLRLTTGDGATITLTDGGTGLVSFNGTLGSFFLNISTGSLDHVIALNTLDLLSGNKSGAVLSAAAGTITVELSEQNYNSGSVPAVNAHFGIGGTTQGVIDYAAYLDASNTLFGTNALIGSGSDGTFGTALPIKTAFDYSSPNAVESISGLYSLTEIVTISHQGYISGSTTINSTTSFDGQVSTTPVPEPGTMMLVGLGMLGMAVYGKRRQNKEA